MQQHFLIDGRQVRLLSGALHYFRVHEQHWDHRLRMLRAMGLNCVETYVPWNLHEPSPGTYHDISALGRFLDAAHAAGLWAIVRPGPYSCGEWENGGLPHWLTGPLGSRVRTSDPEFLGAVERWFDVLLPQVVARETGRGGPVILVQVENEYGSYGSDAAYLEALADGLRERGVTVPLFTSDGPADHMLTGGSVAGALATVNFGSGAKAAFETLRRHQPEGPLMCAEFWCGWFSHWGEEPVTREAGDAAEALREILECGASVNLYMAHGGTNFAGWAGANRGGEDHRGVLQPDVTSYDYDAPVDEFGRPTAKFWAFREVLAPYVDGELPEVPDAPPVLGRVADAELGEWAPLSEVLGALGGPERVASVPPSFEELDVDRGLVRYRVDIPGPREPYQLRLHGLRDLAVAYVDGERVPVGDDGSLGEVPGPVAMEIWVESLGRVNYGPLLGETKGITGGILHERQYVHGVRAQGLRLDAFTPEAVAALPLRAGTGAGRGFHRGTVTVGEPGDAVLVPPAGGRGFVWVNGFCLGRYWAIGPQRELYVPGPVLREGENEIWALELEGADSAAVSLRPVVPA
ncbi:beta-galactosidase [Streptomyces sp. A7024]|uniref:Beta-galactosidase n=1 Tax=Streptomyces coryli TaxID=1128680 RepID=A0A6G4U830_9ACTN|nr:glycoside hydrolase family 35 protein [Streptomyces coryli]NGN67457.1 beta-galactosidase [Streptomyces coryli]